MKPVAGNDNDYHSYDIVPHERLIYPQENLS